MIPAITLTQPPSLSLWKALLGFFVETDQVPSRCHCDLPIIRIKAIGRNKIGYKHGRDSWCYRSYFTRHGRDAAFATLTPEQCGERGDD